MSIQVTVTVKNYQREWITNHPEINVSGLLQKGIIELMKKEKKAFSQKPTALSAQRKGVILNV